MSAVARHRLRLTLHTALLMAILGLLVALLVPSAGIGPAHAQEAADEPSAEDYSGIQRLRGQLALTNEDLAAAGCSQQQAEAVLTALKDWYTSNKEALQQSELAAHAAERELSDLMRRIHVGPRDDAVLARVGPQRQSVEAAKAAQRQQVDRAVGQLASQMGGEQSARWQALLGNRDQAGGYRLVTGVTDQQAEALRVGLAKRTRRGKSATDVESQVLSVSQLGALRDASERMRAHMEGVLAAEQSVLPLPKELLEDISPAIPTDSERDQEPGQ